MMKKKDNRIRRTVIRVQDQYVLPAKPMRPVASGQGLLLAVKAIIFNMIYEHDAMNYRKIIDNNFVYQCT